MAMEESADAEPPPPPPPAVSNGGGASPRANGEPTKPFSSWPVDELTKEVLGWKALFENASSSEADLVRALKSMRAGGDLPTKVLGDTMIGKAVNNVAKSTSAKDAVKREARALVEDWRQTHRKRKASSASLGERSDSGLKGRSLSMLSMDSEAAASPETGAPSLSRDTNASTDSLANLAQNASDEPPAAAEAVPADGAVAKSKMTPTREKVRQKLLDALGKEETIETKAGEDAEDSSRDPVVLAAEIEEALHAQLSEKEYFNQARAIIFNLKDKRNHTFRIKIMVGFFPVKDVPKLQAEDMASDEKNKERERLRKYAMEEIQSDWAIKRGAGISGLFTCGKCKGMKTTYFQMQTRSSDEPMTTFVSCLECGNRWKFC